MKKMKEQLKTIKKSVTALTRQVDQLSKQLVKAEAAQKTAAKKAKKAAKKKPAAKKRAAAKKRPVAKKRAVAKGKTVLDTVYGVISRSKKGVTIPAMRARTKLDARQLSNALYKLTKKNMIKTASRGVYVKK